MKNAQSPPPADKPVMDAAPNRRMTIELCLLVALTAAALTLFFFAPRFVYWRGLFISQRLGNPDNHRAFNALAQIVDPWAPIDNESNNVIAWRLLVPLLWHYLHLPPMWSLAVPAIGAVLTLWLVAWLSYQRLGDWRHAWLATVLCAALPWFFVTTGWLAYYDSWLMLGLVVVAFVPSRVAIGATCLLTPWIDERFVFALPLAFATRAVYLRRIEERAWRELLIDLAVVTGASLPYPAIRAVAWLRGDPESTAYVHKHWDDVRGVSLFRFWEGLWSGFRAAWVMVGACAWFTFRRLGTTWGAVFAALVAGSALMSLVIAADMSRTLAIMTPVMLLGIWQWRESAERSFHIVLATLVTANLLLPAEHVIWPFKMPIRYLYTSIDDWRNPPQLFQPGNYVQGGAEMRRRGDLKEARWYYDTALQLDDTFAPAYFARAALSADQGNLPAVLSDVEIGLTLSPGHPDGLMLRALTWQARGNLAAAIADVREALQTAPPEWSTRKDAEQRLQTLLRQQQGAPADAKP